MERPVRRIAIREVKSRLSELLRDARNGRERKFAERGAPIARIVALTTSTASFAERVRRLTEQGVLRPPHPDARALPPPIALESGIAQRYLAEDRG